MAVIPSSVNSDFQMHTHLFKNKPIRISNEDHISKRTFIQWRCLVYVEYLNELKLNSFIKYDYFFLRIKIFDQICVFKVNKPKEIKRIELKNLLKE